LITGLIIHPVGVHGPGLDEVKLEYAIAGEQALYVPNAAKEDRRPTDRPQGLHIGKF